MLSHHAANFGHHENCGSGDIKVLVSHMILQDHAIKNSSNVMGSSHCGGGHIMVLVCHLILLAQETKGSSKPMSRSRSRQVTILPSLVAIGTLVEEI